MDADGAASVTVTARRAEGDRRSRRDPGPGRPAVDRERQGARPARSTVVGDLELRRVRRDVECAVPARAAEERRAQRVVAPVDAARFATLPLADEPPTMVTPLGKLTVTIRAAEAAAAEVATAASPSRSSCRSRSWPHAVVVRRAGGEAGEECRHRRSGARTDVLRAGLQGVGRRQAVLHPPRGRAPFGLTVPASVVWVWVIPLAAPVTTDGGGGGGRRRRWRRSAAATKCAARR